MYTVSLYLLWKSVCNNELLLLWPYGHSYNCFLSGSNYIYIYIYIYMFVSLVQVCVVYVVKKVRYFGGLGQLIGMAHKRMRLSYRLVGRMYTVNNFCIQQRNSIKMMQESVTSTCVSIIS